ncbi:NF038120 family PEP-CTERM protein [Roseateles sp.]|uniref:NF038120 family PEP-CTERM protein n=1 Tax=Roseateles sp. TaxID=1971397 RepID=UPI003BA5B45C
MKKFVQLSLAIAAAAACSMASAGVVTFEGNTNVYGNGESFNLGQQRLTVGEGGVIVNGSDPFSCTITACPVGNASNYYVGLNDGSLTLQTERRAYLRSLDFGFVLPVDGLVGFSVGQLMVIADDGTTVSQDFGLQNANGKYEFSNWNLGAFSNNHYSSFTFKACLYTEQGDCSSVSDLTMGQAQFAIDNISYDIPEPASLALVAASLGGMFFAGRRRKSV